MENEFQIPENIPVIEKAEDFGQLPGVHFVEKQPETITGQTVKPGIQVTEKQPNQPSQPRVKPGISFGERTFEGYTIPENIPVFEKPEDVYQIPSNIPVKEHSEEQEEIKKNVLSEEEVDLWGQIEEELKTKSHDFKLNDSQLITWLKEKLSGVSFCQVYLTDKLDGENGIVKENSSLILVTDNGSKMYLDKGGRYHRLDGPAIEWHYGSNEWFKNGIRHRIGGAAYEGKDEKQYWFEGKQYTENEYWMVAKEITSLK